jgi:hypothetical protein
VGKPVMNADRNSDGFIVLSTQANEVATATEEFDEGRRLPKESGIAVADVPDTEPDSTSYGDTVPTTGDMLIACDRLIQRRSRMR